ncbi:MAG: glycoside hydrolase family 97 protein [Bacteroidales bacterium]|nr:glycoside hydrolase family 97 protein [Bacteroidales bacterium]
MVVKSPDNNIGVKFLLENTKPYYEVTFQNKPVIEKSALGFKFKSQPNLDSNLQITNKITGSFDETWEQPWGEKRFVRNNYNEMIITLEEKTGLKRKMSLAFRVFNDGIGFRYEIPEQENIDSVIIMDELTEFHLAGNHNAWWIPAYRDNRYEYLYQKNPVNELDTVHTPLTMQTEDSLYIAIHEADLVNYSSMTLAGNKNNMLKCDLVPWMDGTKVKTMAPFKTPWRTIQIADDPGKLITSYLSLNLNEPNKLGDVSSWVKPSKYMGIWWGMHIGKYTFWESDQQGATTGNAKMYIDFASENNIPLLLIEGWNKGWTPQWYENAMHMFSFTDCADGFDLEEVCRYAKSKNVEIIGYHETGSNLINYLKQIDTALAMYKTLGIHNLKIGQVGSRLNMKEWHHGQFGVEYYRHVLLKAAENQMTVNFHEPIKGTGEWRTYPNMLMREGARGMEYDAWSEGNPPDHSTILPFTRMLAGPFDFTPGIFDVTIKERAHTKVHTTVAKQLAFYVVIYSPVQMLADLPENYKGNPAFKFLLDVPTDWEETRVINASIGNYVTIVRKDRNSGDWYLGSITDENERTFDVPLDFLEPGKNYIAEIYADGENADYEKNLLSVAISSLKLDNNSRITIKLARGGGQAIRFHPVN